MAIDTLVNFGLLLIPILLFIGFFSGRTNADRTSRVWPPLKLATSFVLVMAALILWLNQSSSAALLIVLGMTFGFSGDLILAGVIHLPHRLIFAILTFGIGHVLYVMAFVQIALMRHLNDPFGGSVFWTLFVIAASVLWVVLIYNPKQPRVLNVGSLIYAWLISVMTGTAAGLALQDARFVWTTIGGGLFLLSDVILGNRELRGNKWFLINDVVWGIYITGQALIVTTLMRII
ncbi:MAG TPA: lysoplasmalogenase [Anaerolineae bacterium]|nr:lysoplasmalogenase [Anaerolineae bacterium]